ncbi:UDP-3-O-acyl-N-acetylglucosamine deacetylase [Geothrix rubra]|uniref:UDP-3-O-acyl-N-acetylglucosamine deacetylase n=1 Tax=Geothrix rubra TaxID=2927977 RepID=A0ABQ5Q393_9BACT|nr:UDP-3-O-acyl-N-acetylglucosamine deacetylase [Geothrix rubra]GLH69205.1 UDP-3-O-acyl-N-acetylglucosamine deacetylase [Geothrix rubra]
MPRSVQPQTLGREITISGHGLHGNRPCTVRLVPVEAPTGLRFVHLPTGTELPVKAALAGDLVLSTTLVKDGVRLQTIEHLLSALMGLEIEHLRIEVDAEELPILDGSAGPWVEAILEAGVATLEGRRRFLRITRPVEVRQGNRWIRVSPFDGLRLRYTIDFPVPALGRQSRELSLTPEKYRRELGGARTFCLAQEIEAMRARGLALGGSLDNAVVFGNEGPLNESLRFEDEAVRHKMLDLVGDLALLGAPMLGLVEAHAAGHALHVGLTQAILADPSCWEWTEEAVPANVRFFFQSSQSPVAQPA